VLERYRANPIEADAPSGVRVRTRTGTTVLVAGTLAAAEPEEPIVLVHGTRGRIEWRYKRGEVRVLDAPGGAPVGTATFGPPRLLANLLDHLDDPGVPLLVPLGVTGAFTAVLDAVRRAPEPVPIPREFVRLTADPTATLRSVPGIDRLVHRAARELRMFSELGVGWGAPAASVAGGPA
jgi:hypothetical protein